MHVVASSVSALWAALGLCGCAAPDARADRSAQFGPDQRLGAATEIPDGYWRSDGYGYLLALQDGSLRAFDLTDSTCRQTPLDGVTLSDFYDWSRLTVDGQIAQFWTDVEPHPTQYRRIDAFPTVCQSAVEDPSPGEVFDHFAAYMTEHYAFFGLYDVDWPARVQTGRARAEGIELDADLFALLAESLAGIEDAHVDLVGTVDGARRHFSPGDGRTPQWVARHNQLTGAEPDNAASFFNGYWRTNIGETILRGAGQTSANQRLQYGMADDQVGYIALLSVGVFARGTDIDAMDNLIAFSAEMDRALSHLKAQGAQAIILDLSVNFGGFDYISREATRYFAPGPATLFSKQALDTDHRLPPTVFRIEPTASAFSGPVYVVTSDATVSGGEILTLGLRALPNTIHVGETTRGSLSDKLEKPLPNGWTISVSNEAYLDHEGVLWEGIGIAPDCRLTVFEAPDPLGGHRDAIARVIGWAQTGQRCASPAAP